MQVYAEKAIYDDSWSYCDTRYKIAGQWYGEFHLVFFFFVFFIIPLSGTAFDGKF